MLREIRDYIRVNLRFLNELVLMIDEKVDLPAIAMVLDSQMICHEIWR